ncbi:hypothetical protein M9458_006407, partial [Cirrhinus mrigala]
LRRAVRDEEDEEEEEYREEVTEMTEICRITQNGNGSGQPEKRSSGVSETCSPDRRGMGGDVVGKGPGFGPTAALLNGAKNGNVKTLPEEPVEKNTSLEISYL